MILSRWKQIYSPNELLFLKLSSFQYVDVEIEKTLIRRDAIYDGPLFSAL